MFLGEDKDQIINFKNRVVFKKAIVQDDEIRFNAYIVCSSLENEDKPFFWLL